MPAHETTTTSSQFTTTLSDNFGDLFGAERIQEIFGIVLKHPDGLLGLANTLKTPYYSWGFSIEDLDEILEGKTVKEFMKENEPETSQCCSNFLSRLEWWMDVYRNLIEGRNVAYSNSPLIDSFVEQKREVRSLLCNALDAYKKAIEISDEFRLTPETEEDDLAIRIELLKRYRLFTRYICTFAQEVWPEVDLQRLLEMA